MPETRIEGDEPTFKVGPTVAPPPVTKATGKIPFAPLLPPQDLPTPPGDLRFSRPYFLIPLDKTNSANPDERLEEVRGRIHDWVNSQISPVTDVFVISHGWHRNFYEAYAGYDRILSRAAILLRRRRLTVDANASKTPFNPLFLFAHWHSDPGADEFYDPAGRRKKPLFLQNVNALFEPKDPKNRHLTTDFEDMYELLSELASPGQNALSNPIFGAKSSELYTRLQAYRIKDTLADLTPEEKVSTLWRCYNEAEPTGLLNDQTEKTRDVLPLHRAFGRILLIAFVGAVSVMGPVAMLGLLGKWLAPFENWFSQWNVLTISAGLSLFYTIEAIYLAIAARKTDIPHYHGTPEVRKDRGVPSLNVIAWVVLFVPCIVVVLAFCLMTYLFGSVIGGLFLWNERLGNPNEVPLQWTDSQFGRDENEIPRTPREWIIGLARWQNQLAMRASANDGLLYRITSAIDQQLAVAEMQRLGAIAGGRLADFLHVTLAENGLANRSETDATKLHFVGHSFGGLAVCNAARKLVLHPEYQKVWGSGETPKIASLCTVQGAMKSAWFVGEARLRGKIKVLAAVYTRYDTATGYIYPFGFGARLASGSVGWSLGNETAQSRVNIYGKNSAFATLVKPPVLDPVPIPIEENSGRYVLNLDASHLEFEGAPLAGGAHTDIYRDDLVNLIWSVVRLGRGDRVV